ncbi:uncharacterized protein LOC115742533 isoform X2 [Rhodamnia argentea]|uniref:Uncharacterized protein LOC115742533 isoform X2 n=1 Tax=Rhodamnia argentea TaxID=178133 RepID=A0ABM3HNT1_9MYRT|nr:uncharacterized protein LOC115742533 isoform X2 [Rhodamnia argentea]
MDDGREGWSNEEAFLVEECDPDYEFDAARFYDFSRSETCSEVEAAERWFDSAGTYPPSPFIVKLRWSNHDLRGDAEMSSKMDGQEDMNSVTTDTDHDMDSEVSSLNCSDGANREKEANKQEVSRAQQTLKVKIKPLVKLSSPRSSTLMKPTASYLAKQNQSLEVRFSSFLRSDKFSVKDHKTSLQNSPLSENRATKRQKLDAGYLQKVANLKHQTPLHHKLSKRVGYDIDSVLVRRNFTIPREFSLETAHRAQRHSFRSKNRVGSGEHAKSNLPVLKACQLHCKVPLATLRKKSALGFQEVDVSSVSASENVMPEVNRPISADTHTQNCNIVSKFGASANKVETKYQRKSHDPPVNLFEKLSLESKLQLNSKTRSKMPPVTEVVPLRRSCF